MNTQDLTLDAILAIPLAVPERLFSGDPAALRTEWHALIARFHPDHHPDEPRATELLQHVNALHAEALRKLAAGTWEAPGLLRLESIAGRPFELAFRRKGSFELGEYYIGAAFVAYSIAKSERDLFDRALSIIKRFRFRDAIMQAEISRYLPEISDTIETVDRLALVLRRSAGHMLLADLIDHVGGGLEPAHAAWIISGLENLACYLDWAGLMHGAIGPHSVFVSPKHHSVALIGGWWYATPIGARLAALPERTLGVLPPIVADSKRAAGAIDLELIRLTGREMLADASGVKQLRETRVPKPFAIWLNHPPAASAFADYRSWEAARDAGFGARRFVKLAIDPDAIYPPA